VLAQVVGVGSIEHNPIPAIPGNLTQTSPQLRLAEVTTLRRIAEVSRIEQLVGVDLEQRNVELLGNQLRILSLDCRVGRAPPHDREEASRSKGSGSHDGEEGRVDTSGVPEHRAAHVFEERLQLVQVGHAGNVTVKIGER
jgi:hypothetical protein